MLSSLLLLLGAGEEWGALPWQALVSPDYLFQWQALPTFLLCEYGWRATCWLACFHAWKTDRLKSWVRLRHHERDGELHLLHVLAVLRQLLAGAGDRNDHPAAP
eukprot:SAG22_NODE_99_length_20560_cov_128.669029_10_plen_104_part_00